MGGNFCMWRWRIIESLVRWGVLCATAQFVWVTEWERETFDSTAPAEHNHSSLHCTRPQEGSFAQKQEFGLAGLLFFKSRILNLKLGLAAFSDMRSNADMLALYHYRSYGKSLTVLWKLWVVHFLMWCTQTLLERMAHAGKPCLSANSNINAEHECHFS